MNTLITDTTADLQIQIQIQTTLFVLFAINKPGSYAHGMLWRKLDGSGRRTARAYSYRHFYPLQLCSSATGCSCRSTVKQSKAKPSLTRASDLAVGPLVYREHIYTCKKPVHRQAAPPPRAPRPEAQTCSCSKTWRPWGIRNLCTKITPHVGPVGWNAEEFKYFQRRAKYLLCQELHLQLWLKWDRLRGLSVKHEDNWLRKAREQHI